MTARDLQKSFTFEKKLFKLQATCDFRFMCKHIVDNTFPEVCDNKDFRQQDKDMVASCFLHCLILLLIFLNLKRSRNPEHILFEDDRSCLHEYSLV